MNTPKQALTQGNILRGKKTYRIEKVLGNGGFGITYLASSSYMDGNIHRKLHYTIKEFFMPSFCVREESGSVVLINPSAEEEMKKHMLSFQKEAEHLHSLAHPNIVPVNEIFQANNTLYYVMEYLGHLSLPQYVKEKGGKLTAEAARPILLKLAEAVQELHDHRMNHLDIKPANIMMVDKENGVEPVLIDFGLSRHYNRFGGMTVSIETAGVSHGYSPVEQYLGVDSFAPQFDLYALGATAFFMLTGKDPVKSADVTDEYLLSALPKDVTESLKTMVLQCMKVNKTERMASANDLIKLLDDPEKMVEDSAAIDQPTSRDTVLLSASSRQSKKPLPLLTIGVGLAVILALGLGLLFFTNTPSAEKEAEPATVEATKPEETGPAPVVSEPVQSSSSSEQVEVKVQTEMPTAGKGEKNPEKKVNNKHGQLDYADWSGEWVNGRPDGAGTMKFKKAHAIDSSRMAEVGDYIVGEWYNGVFANGKWYSADGTLKETIFN